MPIDNKQELFYWVDENDTVLGSITRQQAHNGSMKIHRSVEIVVTNNNHILLQKRSLKKDLKPGQWTISASGHVDFGESYDEAAIRELSAEISLHLDVEFITKVFHVTEPQREMMAIFAAHTTDTHIIFDTDEIETVEWVSLQHIRDFVQTHPFTEAGKIALHTLNYI